MTVEIQTSSQETFRHPSNALMLKIEMITLNPVEKGDITL